MQQRLVHALARATFTNFLHESYIEQS